MAERKAHKSKSRPFPWRCPNCARDEVFPAAIDYCVTAKKDGISHSVEIRDLEVPRCRVCSALTFDDRADEQISQAIEAHLRTLTLSPEYIRQARKDLHLTQAQFAERLGVAEETISRWETGVLVPSRAMDNLLRIYFAFPSVRCHLLGKDQDRELGTNLVWDTDVAARTLHDEYVGSIQGGAQTELSLSSFSAVAANYDRDQLVADLFSIRQQGTLLPIGTV